MNIDCNSLVLDYLIHHCYGNTARALLGDIAKLEKTIYIHPQTKQSQILERDIQWSLLEARKILIGHINQGRMESAFEVIDQHFSDLFKQEGSVTTLFKLRCQHFVEIIRSGSELDAICYAQKHLNPARHDLKEQVREVTALIAYEDPQQSQSKHLMSYERRQLLAKEVNSIVLTLNDISPQPSIEKLYRQRSIVESLLERLEFKECKSV
ncbi:CTLH/CRA C-terminal to lish motif domain-containing protein [Sporodiniella umbellata]|nr:CTLH/CRA C-terminal to lish motif domain-containing protein [Sporodiniella umbellata]